MSSFTGQSFRRSVYRGMYAALLLGVMTGGFPRAASAQEYVPPDWGLPGRREGGGTRGCWMVSQTTTDPSLVALVPAQNTGYTTQAHPSFFVYVSPLYAAEAQAAEFVLADSQGNIVYTTRFKTTAEQSVIRLDIPQAANVAPLEAGELYQWSFSLVCDEEDRSADIVVDSWIQRTEPSPGLTAALENSTPAQHADLYANAGFWYDALTSVANLNKSARQTTAVTQWQTLLGSVGLSHVSSNMPMSLANMTVAPDSVPSVEPDDTLEIEPTSPLTP